MKRFILSFILIVFMFLGCETAQDKSERVLDVDSKGERIEETSYDKKIQDLIKRELLLEILREAEKND